MNRPQVAKNQSVTRPRLLFVAPTFSYALAHWFDRLSALSLKYEVHVAAPSKPECPKRLTDAFIVHDITLRRGMPNLSAELQAMRSIHRLISKLSPSIVHAVTARPVVYSGLTLNKNKKVRFVASIVGLGHLYGETMSARALRPLYEIALRQVFKNPNAKVVYENEQDRALHIKRQVASRDQSQAFLGGGIDLNYFSYQPALNPESHTVLLATRMLREKGVEQFIAAAKIVARNNPNVRFVLAGNIDEGNPSSLTQKELEALSGAVEQIEWQGFQVDIRSVIRKADIVCLPTHYKEGAPRVLIEAAAIGRACITTDAPGCAEIVVDGVTGLIVPQKEILPLAEAIMKLIDSRALRLKMGYAARKRAEELFSSELATKRLLSVYEENEQNASGSTTLPFTRNYAEKNL